MMLRTLWRCAWRSWVFWYLRFKSLHSVPFFHLASLEFIAGKLMNIKTCRGHVTCSMEVSMFKFRPLLLMAQRCHSPVYVVAPILKGICQRWSTRMEVQIFVFHFHLRSLWLVFCFCFYISRHCWGMLSFVYSLYSCLFPLPSPP